MLGKLLKYELKASARTLLPLYAGTLLIALVGGISMAVQVNNMRQFKQSMVYGTAVTYSSFSDPIDGGINTFIGFSMILVFAFCVAVTVLTVMSVVQRFNHGIAGNEGYLMFTLPVKHETLLASKLLGALSWSLASLLVIFLVGVLIGGPSLFVEREFYDWAYFWNNTWELFDKWNPIPTVLLTLVDSVATFGALILTIYLAIMVGQMEQFNKYRVPVAVIAFFILNWAFGIVESGLVDLLQIYTVPEVLANDVGDKIFRYYEYYLSIDTLYNLFMGAACFFGTVWMMKKKLNL